MCSPRCLHQPPPMTTTRFDTFTPQSQIQYPLEDTGVECLSNVDANQQHKNAFNPGYAFTIGDGCRRFGGRLGESLLAPVLPIFTEESVSEQGQRRDSSASFRSQQVRQSCRWTGPCHACDGPDNGVVPPQPCQRSVASWRPQPVRSGCSACQVVIGFAAGLFFAAGVFSARASAEPGRRGRAHGSTASPYRLGLAIAAGYCPVRYIVMAGRVRWIRGPRGHR